jgi:hypothetical protein
VIHSHLQLNLLYNDPLPVHRDPKNGRSSMVNRMPSDRMGRIIIRESIGVGIDRRSVDGLQGSVGPLHCLRPRVHDQQTDRQPVHHALQMPGAPSAWPGEGLRSSRMPLILHPRTRTTTVTLRAMERLNRLSKRYQEGMPRSRGWS